MKDNLGESESHQGGSRPGFHSSRVRQDRQPRLMYGAITPQDISALFFAGFFVFCHYLGRTTEGGRVVSGISTDTYNYRGALNCGLGTA